MKEVNINVLGETYLVKIGERDELPRLKPENMGECRIYNKQIYIVNSTEPDCNSLEKNIRTREIVAHEIFHAFLNEAGINLDEDVEEFMACFFMKNWCKMNNSILEVLDDLGIV